MDFASINQPPKQPTALALSYVKSGAWDSRFCVCVYLLVCAASKKEEKMRQLNEIQDVGLETLETLDQLPSHASSTLLVVPAAPTLSVCAYSRAYATHAPKEAVHRRHARGGSD